MKAMIFGATLASLALAAMALAGCATQGSLIDLSSGEEIRLEVKPNWKGAQVEGVMADGRKLKGELREVLSTQEVSVSPRWRKLHGTPPADSVYYGTGYLKDGARIIDFEYWRTNHGGSAVGTASDNQGRRFKLLL